MKDTISKYLKEMTDEDNPDFIFQGNTTKLVLAIALGKLDGKKLAAKEMASRGFDKKGKWIGFPQAEKLWGVK
jgi:hypothetical protein